MSGYFHIRYDLSPICVQVYEHGLDGLVGVPEAIFVEFLNVLFLHAAGGDDLLKVNAYGVSSLYFLIAKGFKLCGVGNDVRINRHGLVNVVGHHRHLLCNDLIVLIIKDQGKGAVYPPHAVVSHLLCHAIHGFGGRLSNDLVKWLQGHYYIDRL